MAWYGNHVDASKKLDQLIDQNPNLQQLLNYPDFIQQLKSYNPKLLEFLTNSNTIITDLVSLIAMPPKSQQSDQRKYKLPALAIQMIESQAMSIINSFFKEDPKTKQKYVISMFDELLRDTNKVDGQILPMLAGYFLRVNICLLNNKYKQTINCMYENPKNFDKLIQNCQSLSVTNTLQVYLNLDLTKNSQTLPQRLSIKLNTINNIVKQIDNCIQNERKNTLKSQNQEYLNSIRAQNLSTVLIELLQKYYLIAEGKQMIDQILYQETNTKVFYKIVDKPSEISLSMLNVLISLIKYYTFSSFNSEEWNNPEQNKKNEEKLQSQPAIFLLLQCLPNFIFELGKCQKFTIYFAKIIELINISINLNSHKIFNCVKNCKYIQTLIELLFKFENNNMFSMMVQKLFVAIFRIQRLINEELKHYIFCEAKIIQLTALRYLNLFSTDEQINNSMGYSYRRRGFFGHLMKIMKIYSGIQTTDEDIINSIKNRSEVWNRISRLILKPYQTINAKQLGTYDSIPETPVNQYTVINIVGLNDNSIIRRQTDSTKVIDEINREETLQNLKTLETNLMPQKKIEAENLYHLSHKEEQFKVKMKSSDDEFFNTPTENVIEKLPNQFALADKKTSQLSQKLEDVYELQKSESSQSDRRSSPILGKKSSSYDEFLQRQKMKAETQIKKERSRSKQRALSKGKTKITSPSPSKRVNKWAQGGEEKPDVKEKLSLTTSARTTTTTQPINKNLPKIPIQKKGLNLSTASNQQHKQDPHNKSMQIQKKQQLQNSKVFSKSMVNLQQLKRVKIIYQFQVPTKKQFRKINQEDKAIFDLIGISY